MAENKIVIDRQEFPLNYKLLRIIARMLPQEAHYAPLARAILTLNVPSITSELISNRILEPNDLDAIWSAGDMELRRALMDESAFREHLTDAQASELMAINDVEMLKPLAANSEDFSGSDEEKAPRLSDAKVKELMEFLANHPNREIKKLYHENEGLEARWAKPAREMLEQGYELSGEHIAELTEAELDLLAKSPRSTLLQIAEWLAEIKDAKARDKIGKFLLAHPDPEIRLSLAENWDAPKNILKTLAKDEDEDISAAAKDNLE